MLPRRLSRSQRLVSMPLWILGSGIRGSFIIRWRPTLIGEGASGQLRCSVIRAESVDTSGLFVNFIGSRPDHHFRSPRTQAARAKADTNVTTISSWRWCADSVRGLTTAKCRGRGRTAIRRLMPDPGSGWSADLARSLQLHFSSARLAPRSKRPPMLPRWPDGRHKQHVPWEGSCRRVSIAAVAAPHPRA